MLAITTSAIVAYGYIMEHLSFEHPDSGEAIQIQHVTRYESGVVTVFVQNVGYDDVVLSSVHVDGLLNVPDAYEVPWGSPAILGETVLPVTKKACIVVSFFQSGFSELREQALAWACL